MLLFRHLTPEEVVEVVLNKILSKDAAFCQLSSQFYNLVKEVAFT